MKHALLENGIVDVVLPGPRADSVEIPDNVFAGFIQQPGGSFTAPPAPPPARLDVNNERDRRTASTFVFNSTAFDLEPASLQRITGAATLAGFAIGAGSPVGNLRWANPDADFMWIAKDNSKVSMDAQTAFAFGQAAANHVSRYVFVADAIKSMDPIPADYTDDKWWP